MRKRILVFKICVLILSLFFIMKGYSQQIQGNYAIKNLETEMLLRPKNASKEDNAPIVMYSPVNWKCLTWEFMHIGENNYQLRNLFSSKTIHPENSKAEAFVELKQTPLKKGDFLQQWKFIPVEDNVYRINLKNTDLYLTPANNSGNINTEVILKKKTEGMIQLWTIYKQDPNI